MLHHRNKQRRGHGGFDFFDRLPDDIVISIFCKLSSSARCPADFINVFMTCKRLQRLALHPLVLSEAGVKTLSIKAKNWSEYAHRFLKLCVSAGNAEASYILGMIRYYCLQKRGSGASLMAKAAIRCHAHALYSLAVIQFNGSGGSKNDKDLNAGVELCARAAFFGNVDALRELGHCLQDGYGIRRSVLDGRRLLLQANLRELALVLRSNRPSSLNPPTWQSANQHRNGGLVTEGPRRGDGGRSLAWALWSDFGCSVPTGEPHPVSTFMSEWFELRSGGPGKGLRMCSHSGCGRPETRKSEFRRCSGCGKVHYCSRGCQAHDWKLRHKVECVPMEQWVDPDEEEEDIVDDDDDEEEEERTGDHLMREVEQAEPVAIE